MITDLVIRESSNLSMEGKKLIRREVIVTAKYLKLSRIGDSIYL